MKLTEEHHKWIAGSTPVEGTSSTEIAHWISGAQEAIKKFGGIQWNKYPETKPTEDGYYWVLDENGPVEDVHVAYVFVHNPEERLSGSTHWAEFNLPNQ